MTNFTQAEKDRLFATLDDQTRRLDNIQRGMYGDPDNGAPGLVREVKDLKQWKHNINKKISVISGIAIGGWEGLKNGIEYIKNHI